MVDSGCSKTLMCKSACRSWRPREAQVVTADDIRPVTVEVLIVYQTLPGLDLLLGVDVIAKLGGVHISSSGELNFVAENVPFRASIAINEPDFSATYDQRRRVWAATWKWAGDRTPAQLKN